MILNLSGKIDGNCPTINATINRTRHLVFTVSGKISLTVDTGFTGGLALPLNILSDLDVKFTGYENYSLADGSIIQIKEYFGYVKIGKEKVKTIFIEGDFLIGVEFIKAIADKLIFDFKKQNITFLKD